MPLSNYDHNWITTSSLLKQFRLHSDWIGLNSWTGANKKLIFSDECLHSHPFAHTLAQMWQKDFHFAEVLLLQYCNIAPSMSNISSQTKMKNVLLFFLSETFSQALVKSLPSIGHPPVSGQIFVVLGKPSDFEQIGNIRAILFTTVKASIDYVNNVIPFWKADLDNLLRKTF